MKIKRENFKDQDHLKNFYYSNRSFDCAFFPENSESLDLLNLLEHINITENSFSSLLSLTF